LVRGIKKTEMMLQARYKENHTSTKTTPKKPTE
jgi:hypothetical protein